MYSNRGSSLPCIKQTILDNDCEGEGSDLFTASCCSFLVHVWSLPGRRNIIIHL
ncbi:hypothetical protein KFK09_008134 [Dendrobium nobile]|uniref:Uncharacterized protein n=1 Tax=Dendrobium nobile TaxID=94219 RepID=A0A8T3BX15_DENNO|nr:hypothetical protein KFK09_008134 [Dendrobium nobile]